MIHCRAAVIDPVHKCVLSDPRAARITSNTDVDCPACIRFIGGRTNAPFIQRTLTHYGEQKTPPKCGIAMVFGDHCSLNWDDVDCYACLTMRDEVTNPSPEMPSSGLATAIVPAIPLREWLAGQALAGLMAADAWESMALREVALSAVQNADAVVDALGKTPTTTTQPLQDMLNVLREVRAYLSNHSPDCGCLSRVRKVLRKYDPE